MSELCGRTLRWRVFEGQAFGLWWYRLQSLGPQGWRSTYTLPEGPYETAAECWARASQEARHVAARRGWDVTQYEWGLEVSGGPAVHSPATSLGRDRFMSALAGGMATAAGAPHLGATRAEALAVAQSKLAAEPGTRADLRVGRVEVWVRGAYPSKSESSKAGRYFFHLPLDLEAEDWLILVSLPVKTAHIIPATVVAGQKSLGVGPRTSKRLGEYLERWDLLEGEA